ncbi:FAD:protein FMN transferase [Streptomyces sp. NPDC001450]
MFALIGTLHSATDTAASTGTSTAALPTPLGGVVTTAAADWRAPGTMVRLVVVTDPALLDSELTALDTAAGRPTRVSPLLAVALRAAEATDGAVDPTGGSALDAIGYDRDFTLVREDDRPVALRMCRVPGRRRVCLARATGTVTVPEGVRLDPGATAEAWAADRSLPQRPAPHRRRPAHPGHPGPQGTTRDDITRWAGLVQGRGACHHPDGTVRLVRSALTTFTAEPEAHAQGLCTATDRRPCSPYRRRPPGRHNDPNRPLGLA